MGHLLLEDDHFDLEPVGGESTRIPPTESLDAALDHFDTAVTQARAAVGAAEDGAWQEGWSLKSGGYTLFTLPRAEVMRSMVLNHLIHHRGQLMVYLRLCDVAVPALYGPSADEAGS